MTDLDWFRRLEDIWDAAMERPPADRAAFLREACGNDEVMRPELEAALANVSRAEVFLEQPLAALAAQVMEPPTHSVLTGLRLNALVIGPLIGAGGMGQVYRAREPSCTAMSRSKSWHLSSATTPTASSASRAKRVCSPP